MTEEKKPKVNSASQKELEKVEKQFEEFDQNIKSLTQDRMNEAPKLELEQQTKLSSREIANSKDVYLKPKRTISCREKFNEEYRDQWNEKKEYVYFIAENKEIIGEHIDMWTKPFAGVPAEEWDIPCNKPVWGPRYLAEQIKKCYYHRLVMRDAHVSADGLGTYYGTLAADTMVQRLDAIPAQQKRSLFMGASGF